jgi:prepilin-type N-terminal cleavage/methylation domain-containing protein
MNRSARQAFTLIELLVVIAVIGTLVGVILPVYGNVQMIGKRTQSMNNMRQLGAATLSYCNDNNGSLPQQGDKTVTWQSAASGTAAENSQWYNAVPQAYGNCQNLSFYVNNPAAFYQPGSIFFVPAAKYASTKLTAPLFALAFNSKLLTSSITSLRLQNIMLPAQTVLYQEAGLPGETQLPGQSTYTTQSYSYASRTAARYNGNTILTFCDGHADVFAGSAVVASTGKAYFVAYPGAFPAGAARIYWEYDPTVSPN